MALTKVTGQVIKDTTDITVGVLTVTNTLAVGGTVSIGGTLTYEDVTNVDAVGLITARNGIVVGSGITLSKDGDIFATGITTVSGNVKVGSGVTLSPDGDVFATGISTFSEGFAGDVLIDDKIVHRGDTDTAIRFPEADKISFETGGSERVRIDSSGRLLVGTDSSRQTRAGNASYHPDIQLESGVAGLSLSKFNDSDGPSRLALQKARGSQSSPTIVQADDEIGSLTFNGWDGDTFTNTAMIRSSVDGTPGDDDMPGNLEFYTTADGASTSSERMRITSDGKILINHDTGRGVGNSTIRLLQVEGTGGDSGISVVRNSNNTSGAGLMLGKSRTNSVGGNTIVNSGDKLGVISFCGADGTDLLPIGAQITGEVDGTPGENDMPGRLVFKTTADGSSSSSTAMVIKSDGDVGINVDSPDRKLHVGGSFIRVDDGYGLDTSGSTEKIILDNGFITFSTGAGTEAVRINSSQQLLFKNGSAATPGLAFISNTDAGFWSNSDNNIYVSIDGATEFRFNISHFSPGTDNTNDLGNQSYRWDDVRATNTSINSSSDRNEKNTIVPSDLGLDFINKLTPVSFKWNKSKDGVGKRTHYGLISQDIEDLLPKIGKTAMDFGGFLKDEVDDEGNPMTPKYGLRYGEFISPMIKAIQELSAENTALKARVAALEG